MGHVMADIGSELPMLFIERYSSKTTGVSRMHWTIFTVLLVRTKPEIRYSVIRFITVEVVELKNREFTVHIEPREPMCNVERSIDTDLNVTLRVGSTCRFTDSIFSLRFASRKHTRHRVVVEQLLQSFLSQHQVLQRIAPYGCESSGISAP